MSNTKAIRQRIKGVQTTAKITRAMEMVASSKMRKAQERGLAGRPYSDKIKQVIADLAALNQNDAELHPLLRPTTSGGEGGGLLHDHRLIAASPARTGRQSAIRLAYFGIYRWETEGGQAGHVSFVTVGRKGRD